MPTPAPTPTIPPEPAAQRQALLTLLRQEPRGSAGRQQQRLRALIGALERGMPANLAAPGSLAQLEGVWELRWCSSRQPYLAVAPWFENLQLLAPSQGRAMNLLRLPGLLGPLAAIAVEATIQVETPAAPPAGSAPQQRVQVRFRRGGWLGPPLGNGRLQLLRTVHQSFPAWLDITVLDEELRLCRGNAGTQFALLRRSELSLEELLPPG
ncbi:MAG: PAP/fibrillin family protein [Cyanobacteriota bacterium]